MRMSMNHGVRRLGMVCGLLAVALFVAGCRTTAATQSSDIGQSPAPAAVAPPTAAGPAGDSLAAGPAPFKSTSDVLRKGDTLRIALSDLPLNPPPMEVIIKEDGTITGLPLLTEPVKAEGKTTRELEIEIRRCYVPDYYKRMTVVVNSLAQFYSVKGEVKSPNRYPYASATTVLKAITSAGDFTDFARRTTVKVCRYDGRVETEDCIKALRKPSLDLPVYPGDLIVVERKRLPWQK